MFSKFTPKFIWKGYLTAFVCVVLWAVLFFLTQTVQALPVNKKIIVIDAGHGDWDPGKMSKNVHEKDINLAITEKLQWLFELGGAVVLTTRSTDAALAQGKREDLGARARLANTANADIYLSIHQNSFESPSVSGGQVFYYADSESSKILAEKIQVHLNTFVGDHRGAPRNRESKASDTYYVLKRTSMPAVIVECGFMSNAKDLKLLQDEDFQERIAWAVYMGVIDYFKETDKPQQ